MQGSLTLGRVKGIRIRVHWTFLLLIGWIVFLEASRGSGLEAMLWSVSFILVLFGCVVLHELGHALTAMRFGIGTRQIILLPIGGVASLEEMPEDPREELLVAVAGPAVNIVIAMLLYLLLPMESFINQDPEMLEETMSTVNAQNFLFYLFSANVMLVLFNMLPAFPMDGGRILRALLAMRMQRTQATQIAARLGQATATLFFILGLIYNPILALVGVFVFFGAQGENIMVQQAALLTNRTAREAMMTEITVLDPDIRLSDVADMVLSGTERDFIVAEDNRIVGLLQQSDLMNAYKHRNHHLFVREIMNNRFETVHPGDDLNEVLRKLRSINGDFIPVVEDNRPVGAIDTNNINEFIVYRSMPDRHG